ncbi:hypothetical protein ABFU27_18700 [Xanthomonas campestris pv. raphani]|uniref:hypothetical protein n=1 Tax=Xanthomonas campestris TaxID=339 RepID=UPI00096CD384|nr:hypothetical protein [Xanthomonas campestris]MCC5063318.1 hypothetical protein [Xanthomonas campestris pv. raphani]MCC8487652.1 hypothetical protein [Xanthomonas campestris]MCC8691784.1 hypothetical protein [Xanthomonas campestris]MCF8828279.1 hypothetical protein [Xanthomonas campestris pv. raphani]MEA9651827.1 hypothetical protein [Xanthomonas campestris pv. raphani]
MLEHIEKLCDSLEDLGDYTVKVWKDDRTLSEAFGWNCPGLTRHDLGGMATKLAARIRNADIQDIDSQTLNVIESYPGRIEYIKSNTVPHLYNGNATGAFPAYIQTIEAIEALLRPHLDWQEISDNRLIPTKLRNRLRSMQATLDEIVPDRNELQASIKQIADATEAADSLPADLESLKRARNEVEKISTSSATALGRVEEHHKQSEQFAKKAQGSAEEADKLVKQCQEAYRITTTTGLAASFDARAKSLNNSMWAWVVGLLVALGIGTIIGSSRVRELTAALQNETHWAIVLTHAVLSALSVGAPIWFAWLATKQIGQRFRLAEDYGFKASVAKAYEGYRREAARIDKAFEARLFGSALTRLEEAPLRLVEETTHGSPWHELVSSKAFQSAMDAVPSLRKKFLDITVDKNINNTLSEEPLAPKS